MFVIRLAQKYENIVTTKTLKVITIILLLCCVTFSSMSFWERLNPRIPVFYYWWIIDSILKIVIPVVVLLAHLYIPNFVLKRWDLKQFRMHYRKNHNSKRLTKTIICICISQLIFAFPYSSHQFFLLFIKYSSSSQTIKLSEWLGLLRYCQCFSNAIIILLNQKKKKISKQIDKKQHLIINKSRMGTRLWTLETWELFGLLVSFVKYITVTKTYDAKAFTFFWFLVTARWRFLKKFIIIIDRIRVE